MHNMSRRYYSFQLTYLVITVLVVIADLWTKQWAQSSLGYYESVPLLPFLSFTLAYNTGAAFSFLSQMGGWQHYVFLVVAICAIGFIVYWLLFERHSRLMLVALTSIMGGAVGNLYDRMTIGKVIDFIHLHAGEYSWPIFNVADIAISIGAILIAIDWFFLKNKSKSS